MGKVDKKIARIQRLVLICNGSDCKKKGAKSIAKAVKHAAKDAGEFRSTHIVKTKCNGFCKQAPVVGFSPGNHWFTNTDEDEVSDEFRDWVKKG